jgi:hypothetical protein
VKLRPSPTPDTVHGRLSFRKELLGLKSEMVSSGQAHTETWFPVWPRKRTSDLRLGVNEYAPSRVLSALAPLRPEEVVELVALGYAAAIIAIT